MIKEGTLDILIEAAEAALHQERENLKVRRDDEEICTIRAQEVRIARTERAIVEAKDFLYKSSLS